MPSSDSAPDLETMPPGGGLHDRRRQAVARATDELRRGDHRVTHAGQRRHQGRAALIGRDPGRVGQQGEGAGDLDQREGVGQDATVVTGRDQVVGRDAERPGDRRTDRRLAGMVGLPIVLERPAGVMAEQDAGGVEAGAHVPDGAGRLAIACQPDPGQLVERRPGGPAGEQVLAQGGTSEDGLEGADVEVLTMMRGGHHGQLGIGQVELVGGSGLDQREQREGLDGAAQA